MRKLLPDKLRAARVMGDPTWGATGAFQLFGPCGESLRIVASTGDAEPECAGWEHVSVSTRRRVPNWREMCFVKDLFWEPEEIAIQLHPPQSQWISNHPYCLHLWGRSAPPFLTLPPSHLVGVKDLGELNERTAAEARRNAGLMQISWKG